MNVAKHQEGFLVTYKVTEYTSNVQPKQNAVKGLNPIEV